MYALVVALSWFFCTVNVYFFLSSFVICCSLSTSIIATHVIVCGSLFVHNRCCHNFCWFRNGAFAKKKLRVMRECNVAFPNSCDFAPNTQRQRLQLGATNFDLSKYFFFNSRTWVFKCVCVCVYLRIMVSLFLILMNALCISSKQFYQHFFWCMYLCQLINFSSMCECEKNHIICECKRKIPLNSIEICQQYHLNMTMHLKLASFFISGFGYVKQYRCSWFFETVIK